MRRVKTMAVALVPLLAIGCRTAGEDTAGERTTRAAEVERVELRLDERYVDPAGGLEVRPLTIGVNRVRLAVRVDGIARTIDLNVGPLGRETFSPYTFELVSTSLEPSVTLLISRTR
jgi:hypothetical protein